VELGTHLPYSGLYYKGFTIVIYDRNDSTITETITIKLNYDRKGSVVG
jgi:hypothetical protein